MQQSNGKFNWLMVNEFQRNVLELCNGLHIDVGVHKKEGDALITGIFHYLQLQL